MEMTKTEAQELGEKLKGLIRVANGRHANDHPGQYLATHNCDRIVDQLVALANSIHQEKLK